MLSEAQKQVINLMKTGWELGKDHGFGSSIPPSCRLQEDGIGRGGKSIYVNGNTVNALVNRRYITVKSRVQNTTTYKLTVDGMEANLDK